MSTWTTSIKKSETLFGVGQDLDGDGASGLVDTALTAISTDTAGASLKKDSENSLYIKYESDMIKHLREVEKSGNPDYDALVKEGRLTDEFLLED